MRVIIYIIFVLFAASIFLISGCSQHERRMEKIPWQEFNRTKNFSINFSANQSRDQMFGEMQEAAVQACQNKNQGEACAIQTPRAEIEGNCTLQNTSLVCIIQGRPGARP